MVDAIMIVLSGVSAKINDIIVIGSNPEEFF